MKLKNWTMINSAIVLAIVGLFLIPTANALTWTKGGNMGYTFNHDPNSYQNWDTLHVASPSPLWETDNVYMWYMGMATGQDWRIGLVKTTNPLKNDWFSGNTTSPGKEVFWKNSVSGKFDSTDVRYPMVTQKPNDSSYYMWYTGNNGGTLAIGLAKSTDKITWTRQNNGNAVLTKSASGWDSQGVQTSYVDWDTINTQWEMWYGGCSAASTCDIGYATSTDGITWTKYANNPVITHGTSGKDSTYALHPWVLYDTNLGEYEMWYSGYDGSHVRIIHEYSSIGCGGTLKKSWCDKEIYIDIGASGEYDSVHATLAGVYRTIDNEYRFLYTGHDGTNERIMYGMSYSVDPNYFYKFSVFGPIVLEVSEGTHFDTKEVRDPSVIYDSTDTVYKMWYSGRISGDSHSRIGYSASNDPDTGWTRGYYSGIQQGMYASVLSIGSYSAWDNISVSEPSVIKDGSTYKMWYMGYNGTNNAIGYATSSDGESWTKYASNPILQKGTAGAWDESGVFSPMVLNTDSTHWYMWYMGKNSNGICKIGYATSSDGISWTKNASNPIMSPSANNIDADGILYPSVFLYSGTYYMSYTCRQVVSGEEYLKICEATSTDRISWTKKVDGNNKVVATINVGSGLMDNSGTASSTILYQNGWKIWYSGVDRDYDDGDSAGWHWRIGYATGT